MDLDAYESLRAKIGANRIRVGIIGLGYVGLPLARAFAGRGYPRARLRHRPGQGREARRAARATSATSPPNRSRRMVGRPASRRPTEFERLAEADAIIICVPTPLTEAREPDLTYVVGLGPGDRRATCGPASSSSWRARPTRARPATCVLPILEAGGLPAGRDFFLAYSPEREDPGNPDFSAADDPQGRRRPRPAEPASWPRRSMRRGRRPGRAGLQPARSPRRARSSRTPTAPSTSPWSTS